jgi:NAD(P)-dependent dehydrogenase (short-subunit alcohol dehydrogenase family)
MHIRLKPVQEQVVVIIGASSGIGRASALQFAKEGASVVVAARSKNGIDSLVNEIEQKYHTKGKVIGLYCDVTDSDQVKKVVETTIQTFGRIDSWVHVSAVMLIAKFQDITEQEFQRVMDVNFMGQCRGVWSVLPHLKQHGGALILVSSLLARRSLPYWSAYSSSKHALNGFIESLRVELQEEKAPVSVTEILPANIDTPFYNKARIKVDGGKNVFVGLPPTYKAEHVASSIVYAASHPTRELVVGTLPYFLQYAQALCPSVIDTVLNFIGKPSMKTSIPKIQEDNLFAPMDKYNTVEGHWNAKPMPISIYNSIIQTTYLKYIILGLILAIVAGLVTRIFSIV